MRKKRRQKTQKVPGQPPLSSEEKALLDSLLENPKAIDPTRIRDRIPSPELAYALVERLPADDPLTSDLLRAIGQAFQEKNVRKAVKKALFKLRQKGLSVPHLEPVEQSPFAVRRVEKEEPRAYLGAIDRFGSRGIFLIIPQIARGVDVGMGVANDEEGIKEFYFARYSKKQMREVKDLFFQHFQHMVETSLPHAATVLEKAYAQNQESSGDSSSEYHRLRPWILENTSLLDRPAIYEFITQDRVSERILTDSQIDKLFTHELMKSWFIDPQSMKPVLEKISEVEGSRILISDVQKEEYIKEAKEKGISGLFPERRRSIMKTRLEEMAYVLYRLHEEDYALISLSAALSLHEKDTPFAVNPFLKALLDRSLSYYEALKNVGEPGPPKEERSPRIITP